MCWRASTTPLDAASWDLALAGLFPSRPRDLGDGEGPLDRVPRFKPYSHQVEMLRRGIRRGAPGIVTSGTGSGKTESFLLPLLARIVQEAVTWPKPLDGFLGRRWWQNPRGEPYTRSKKDGEVTVSYSAIPRTSKDAIDQGEPDRAPETFRPDKQHATRSPFKAHRTGEHPDRPAAVRALVIYPMNALVEDQLVRLRMALDSREAREVMDDALNGNRIFFGRYTGATPVTGHHLHPGLSSLLRASPTELEGEPPVYFPDHAKADDEDRVHLTDLRDTELRRRQRKLAELFDFMVDAEEGQRQARLHAIEQNSLARLEQGLRGLSGNGKLLDADDFIRVALDAGLLSEDVLRREFSSRVGRDWNVEERDRLGACILTVPIDTSVAASSQGPDAPFLFPSIDGSEQISRWDMQAYPPDILITNVSMLSAMLNREVESPIFEKTREWLKGDDAYFYIVLDELHLQRGAAGTEVAYLLRLLLHRLGLTAPGPAHKVRVLASSASLPAEPRRPGKEQRRFSLGHVWHVWPRSGTRGESSQESVARRDRSRSRTAELLPRRSDLYHHADPTPPLRACYGLDSTSQIRIPPSLSTSWRSLHQRRTSDSLSFGRTLAEALNLCQPMAGPCESIVRDCIAMMQRIVYCGRVGRQTRTMRRLRRTYAGQRRCRNLAVKLFGVSRSHLDSRDAASDTVRALLFVRGSGDGLGGWLGRVECRSAKFSDTHVLQEHRRPYTLPFGTERDHRSNQCGAQIRDWGSLD